MVRTFLSDRFHSNLMVPGPDVHPPMENIEKINIAWGADPPMNCDKWLENDLPGHLQSSNFACAEVLAWQ